MLLPRLLLRLVALSGKYTYVRGVARGSAGGAGRTGRHLLGAANGRKIVVKIHMKI